MSNPLNKLPAVSKNIIGWAALGTGILVAIVAIPKSVFNFKPDARFEEKAAMGILADSQTGDLFSYLQGKDGERYIVKLDKTPEYKVRGQENPNKEPVEEPKPIKSDVRSGRIFTEEGTTDLGNIKYKFTASIKWRRLERSMLYRIAIAPIKISDEPCVTKQQWQTLDSFYKKQTAKNKLELRFEDSNEFWIQDLVIPLSVAKANNKITTVIDSKRDECGKLAEIVYHGQAPMRLPTFTWVENGKLLFKGLNQTVGATKPAVTQKPN